jgi:hypothetical protein
MKHRSKIVMGSAIGLATIAVAIDHTMHHVPEPAYADIEIIGEEGNGGAGGSPCALDAAPCSLESPCSM